MKRDTDTTGARNLRKLLERVSTGLLEQAEGVRDTDSDVPHNLRAYAGWLGSVAEHVRYDGTVDWDAITDPVSHLVPFEPSVQSVVEELRSDIDELQERVENPGETDEAESVRTQLSELSDRIDSLETADLIDHS